MLIEAEGNFSLVEVGWVIGCRYTLSNKEASGDIQMGAMPNLAPDLDFADPSPDVAGA